MKRIFCAVSVFGLLLTGTAVADELHLRSGSVITGSFVGGDTRSVRFIGPEGTVRTYSVGDVASIDFVTAPTAMAPTAPLAPTAPRAPTAPARSIYADDRSATASPPAVTATVAAGTVVTVRMIDSIDADVTGAGERFRASIDDPISVDGRIVIPRGADATVQVMRVEQSGTVRGSDEIALKLYGITVNGKPYELATNYAEIQGKGKGGKTGRNAAIGGVGGAILGGILGGGKGAAIGAGAGAGTGVAVAAARGTKLKIPSESRLDFVLRSPLGLQ
ncbi:MAG: hypothetical protein O2968_12575 [Acidobacteria bacterium]|nr:hypothetical protein [Acidobacteriota bacterium]